MDAKNATFGKFKAGDVNIAIDDVAAIGESRCGVCSTPA